MREIKFRVWDNKVGDMHDVTSILFERKGCWYHDHVAGEHGFVSFDDCVLEQYTGLKDKNGTPIFEGDIVHHIWSNPSDWVVAFRDGCFGVDLADEEMFECLIGWEQSITVIGNIHEGVK